MDWHSNDSDGHHHSHGFTLGYPLFVLILALMLCVDHLTEATFGWSPALEAFVLTSVFLVLKQLAQMLCGLFTAFSQFISPGMTKTIMTVAGVLLYGCVILVRPHISLRSLLLYLLLLAIGYTIFTLARYSVAGIRHIFVPFAPVFSLVACLPMAIVFPICMVIPAILLYFCGRLKKALLVQALHAMDLLEHAERTRGSRVEFRESTSSQCRGSCLFLWDSICLC